MPQRFGVNSLHLFAIALVLAETLTDSVVDSVVYIFTYSAYVDFSRGYVPYLFACLLPSKRFYKTIIVLYIPVLCLWRAGRHVAKKTVGSSTQEEEDILRLVNDATNFECVDAGHSDERNSPPQPKQRRNRAVLRSRLFLSNWRRDWRVLYQLRNQMRLLLGSRCRYLAQYQAVQVYGRIRWCIVTCTAAVGKIPGANTVLLIKRIIPVQPKVSSLSFEKNSADVCAILGSDKSELAISPTHPLSGCEGNSRAHVYRRQISWGELVHGTDERFQNVLKQHNKRYVLYKKIPLRAVSRLWGRLHRLDLPVWLRAPAVRLYVWMFGCTLSDAVIQDLTQYRNISEFFRRLLRPEVRPIHSAHILTSPADGTVLHCGRVEDGVLEQVKGVVYSLRGFLGPVGMAVTSSRSRVVTFTGPAGDIDTDDDAYYASLLSSVDNSLFQCVVYLAPGDYHRFHSPADWTVFARRHFPGELFSVNPGIARWLQGVFSFNERAAYIGRWTHGFFSVTAVGATNVGSISVYFDKTLATNNSKSESDLFYDASFTDKKRPGIRVKKGQLFGEFNLGSTIVLLFEAPSNFKFCVQPGQKVKYGQGLSLGKTLRPAWRVT